MKLNFYLIIILLFTCIYGCNYNYEKKETFSCYYDEAKTKIKMMGDLEKGYQNGEWKYFDLNGSIIQHGTLQNGLIVGKWDYNFTTMKEKTINWDTLSNNKFKFSLPNSFKLYKDNKEIMKISYVDKINKCVLSLAALQIQNENDFKNYLFKTIDEYRNQFVVMHDSLQLIKTNKNSYYYYCLTFSDIKHNYSGTTFNILTKLDNKMINVVYTCNPSDSIQGRFLIGEIFYHCFFDGKLVSDPLLNITEIENIKLE